MTREALATITELVATRLETLAAEVRALARSSDSPLAALAQPEQQHNTCADERADVSQHSKSLMGQDEFATILGVHPRTLQRMRLSGAVPPALKFGRQPKWRRSDVENWIEGLKVS